MRFDLSGGDLQAHDPADPSPEKPAKDWSLINKINQKALRPQDKPVLIDKLEKEDQDLIRKYYPELFK